MKRLRWPMGVLFLGVLLFGTFQIAHLLGRGYEIVRHAEADTMVVYQLLEAGEVDLLARTSLVEGPALAELKRLDEVRGRVLSVEVEQTAGPVLGLPAMVWLKVRREKGVFREQLVRHSSLSAFEFHDIDNRR